MKRKDANQLFDQEYVHNDQVKPISIEDGFRHAVAVSGRSGWAIVIEMLRLMIGRAKIDLESYFCFGLYRKEKTFEQKSKYVTLKKNTKLTDKLSPINRKLAHGLFHDKIMFNSLMENFGFKVPELQLYVGVKPTPVAVRRADDWQQMQRFFENDVVFPVFCKPTDGTMGLGSVSVVGYDRKNRNLVLGNGKKTAIDEFCQNVFKFYGRGYMIESFVKQHAQLNAMFGSVPTVFRIVTALERNKEPEILYTYVRFTGEKGMGLLEKTAKIYRTVFDPTTGKIMSDCFQNSKFTGETLVTEGKDGTPVKGFEIPFSAQVIEQCINIHKLFPAHGWVGFDVVITDDGPIFLEGNTNPICNHAQVGLDQGILDGPTARVIERVIASRAV